MIVDSPAPAGARSAGRPPDRRVITTVVAIQLASCLGFFAVAAHLVAHLRHDLGLPAGTVGLILGAQVGLQSALLLPVGALTDLLGPRRTGAIACVLRALGFVLLGTVDGVGPLLCAAVVLALGGALYNPAAQCLLAGAGPDRRSGGFAGYVAMQHVATVFGPVMGLAILSVGRGFAPLAATAAALWATGGVLFLLVPHRSPQPAVRRRRELFAGVRTVFGDRSFLLFALAASPTTLLANGMLTAVPLLDFTPAAATLCFCVLAAVAAAAQPFVAAGHRGERPWVLRLGLLCAAAAFCVLAPLDGTRTVPLLIAAVLNGLSNGLIQPAVFQRTARHAPAGHFGAYYGVLQSAAGLFSFAGDLLIGRLFDLGAVAATAALIGLGACALAAAIGVRDP
ncbi:MFS transporter [Actinomadura nitritigenes]|uniref:MFS transporter n=1 Tax=Actinomadura nitritigenes TaxID=134602 RepID=UPI003D91B0CE